MRCLRNCDAADDDPQGVLIQLFDLACKKLDFISDESSARRVLHFISGQMVARRRTADKFNKFLLLSTEEVIQAHREAKRAGRSDRARQSA